MGVGACVALCREVSRFHGVFVVWSWRFGLGVLVELADAWMQHGSVCSALWGHMVKVKVKVR